MYHYDRKVSGQNILDHQRQSGLTDDIPAIKKEEITICRFGFHQEKFMVFESYD